MASADEIVPEDFEAALCDDINTPAAFAVLSGLADAARHASSATDQYRTKATLLGAAHLIGLLHEDPEVWFKQTETGSAIDAVWVQSLLDARQRARAARDFARADEIRKELAEKNIVIEDGADGARWKVVSAAASSN